MIVDFMGQQHEFPDDWDDGMITDALQMVMDEQARTPQQSDEFMAPEFNLDNYVGMLADLEGVEDHESLEGGPATRAFGVKYIPAGVDQNLEGKELATAVAQWHSDSVKEKLSGHGIQSESLPSGMQTMLVDLHYNTGSLFTDTPRRLASGDTEGAILNTLNIIGATERGQKVTYGGLAVRRARMANAALEEAGLSTIAQVVVNKLNPRQAGGAKTEYQYLGAGGEVIHRVRTTRELRSTDLENGSRVFNIGDMS